MVFSRIGRKVLVSKKCFNTAGRGILSQSRMHIFKNFPDVFPPQTQSFQYPLLSQFEHTAGYRDPCLLPLLKQSHHNDLNSPYHNVHEMQKITKKGVSLIFRASEGRGH